MLKFRIFFNFVKQTLCVKVFIVCKFQPFDKHGHRCRAGAKQPVHLFFGGKGLGIQQGASVWVGLPKPCCKCLQISIRATLHLEVGPIPLEVDCMKFKPFLGWRPGSTTHYNMIIMGANFPICKGLRVKKPSPSNKSSIIQWI